MYNGTNNVFLRLYIEDSSDNLFVINHSPCELFLKTLKKSFPKSKTAFVIHDLGWRSAFLGDKEKFKEVIKNTDSEDMKKAYQGIIDYFLEEQRTFKIVDKIIVLAKETETLLKEIYDVDENKLFFTLNGLRDSRTQPKSENERKKLKAKLHLSKHEKVVLYTGRTNQAKGSFQLLSCFKNARRKYESHYHISHIQNSYRLLLDAL